MYSHGFVSRLDAFPNAGQYHDLSVRNGVTPSLLVVMRSESTATKRVTAGRVAGRGTSVEGRSCAGEVGNCQRNSRFP